MKQSMKKVGEIAQVLSGYHARKRIKAEEYGTHHLLQVGDFNAGRTAIESEELIRFSPSSVKGEQMLREGDVLFLAKGGKPFGFAPTGLPDATLAAGYFFILRPEMDVHPGYLAWALSQDASQRYFATNSGSSTHMPVVRRAVLENLTVSLPPLERQERIVELNRLMLHEQELYEELVEKKRRLWNTVCVNAATNNDESGSDHV